MADDKEKKVTIWGILNSNVILLILGAVFAGSSVPSCIQKFEERKWQFEAREKMLVNLDKAAGHILAKLRDKDTYLNTSLETLQKNHEASLDEMNFAMVRIRLLYGDDVLKRFINEVDSPLKAYLRRAIEAKRRGGNNLNEFLITIPNEMPKLIKTVDDWEHILAQRRFVSL